MLPNISEPTGYSIQGSGPPIVLLHSSMSSKSQWGALIKELEVNCRVFAVDLLGYGDLTYPKIEHSFSLTDEIEWLETIFDKEIGTATPVHLVGHSYGAAIALKLSHKHPKRINALTLFEPVAFHLLSRNDIAFKEIERVYSSLKKKLLCGGEKAATEIFVDYWSGTGTFVDLSENAQKATVKRVKKVVLDFQALFQEPLSLKDYANISVPCCLISGQQSPFPTRRIMALLKETLPNNVFHQVSGGHMSPVTDTSEINRIIGSFVRKNFGSKET